MYLLTSYICDLNAAYTGAKELPFQKVHQIEGWGAGVETQKNERGEIEGWGRVPFNEPYAPSLSTIYDGV